MDFELFRKQLVNEGLLTEDSLGEYEKSVAVLSFYAEGAIIE